MHVSLKLGIAAAVGCVVLAGFAADRSGTEILSNGAARVVTIRTGDFFFQAPDTIISGVTTIRLEHGGADLHHVQLVRLDDGHTLAELVDAAASGSLPAWAHMIGGPNTPSPGGTSLATLDLKPGRYGILCWVHGADGVSHFRKGMYRALVVVPAPIATGGLPTADVDMVLDDYRFTLSAALEAGTRTIRVRNVAGQPHEVVIAQLAPGKSAGDLLAWIMKQDGPPPARPVGGTTLVAHDGENFVTADFAPGRYALLCFVPDAKDGQPHVAHGMISEIEVVPSTLAGR